MAKQFATMFEDECAPFQYALSKRAVTKCVGHMFCAATDANHNATVLSVDGIGACDHVLRASMLGRLATTPGGARILPFVRLSFASPSRYSWLDGKGQRWTVVQVGGEEQGDPLITLKPGEQLCAFLDDVCALCDPERVKAIHEMLAECLWRVAGIQLRRETTKVWNKRRVPPPNVDQLGLEARHPECIKVLGTPIGSAAFTLPRMTTRVVVEQSAGPRANHRIRTLPPELSSERASEHDGGLWETVVALLGQLPGTPEQLDSAKIVASLPVVMGGLGLRSTSRCARAVCWLRGPTRSL